MKVQHNTFIAFVLALTYLYLYNLNFYEYLLFTAQTLCAYNFEWMQYYANVWQIAGNQKQTKEAELYREKIIIENRTQLEQREDIIKAKVYMGVNQT